MTHIHIKAGPFDSEARLEQESASKTCELFLSLLPYKQRISHARWSGEGCWIPLGNTDLGLGFENATSYPAPGQFLLYPGGELAMMDLILVLLIAEAAAHAMGEYTSLADGVVMDAFDHILNWKLIQGSHPFPGKDGATCINEAAIVAAGFPYQAVRSGSLTTRPPVTRSGNSFCPSWPARPAPTRRRWNTSARPPSPRARDDGSRSGSVLPSSKVRTPLGAKPTRRLRRR